MTNCTATGVDAQGVWTCELEAKVVGQFCRTHYEQQRQGKSLTRFKPRRKGLPKRKPRKVERHDPQDMLCRIPEGHQRCSECEEVKPLDEFNNSTCAQSGKKPWCRSCEANRRIDHIYGEGAGAYKREQLEMQGGRCAICRTEESGGHGWHLDHNHKTGELRKVLCANCNMQLGWYERNKEAVDAYLEP